MVDDQAAKTDSSSPDAQSSAVSPCSTRSSSSGSNSSHSTPSAYSHRKSKSSGATPSAATTSAWSSGVRSPSGVHLLAVLADPGGERGELGNQRRPAGLGREFRQRQQADRRQRVGQPERLLDVDVLVLEVIGDTVRVDVVVVVGHGVEPIGLAGGRGTRPGGY